MDEPNLTSERGETIINLLRDNPGVSITLGDISDETGLPVEELAAHLEELVGRNMLEKDVTPDGFDVYRFPAGFQSGTMAPPL